MTRGFHAADGGRGLAFTPCVEFSNFFASLKPVVAYHHHAVRQVTFMGAVPAIAIDLVPISRLEAVSACQRSKSLRASMVHLASSQEVVAHQAGGAPTRIQQK